MNQQYYESLVRGARILSEDKHGIKVLETPTGQIIKIFRLKGLFSSGRIFSYAQRFARNARLLCRRDVATVEVLGVHRVRALAGHIVIYRSLPGETLREILTRQETADSEKAQWLSQFAVFFAQLHQKGILFRSAHFGNILIQPDRTIAIIDIADMRFRWRGGLWPWQRVRNFRHICRYPQDRAVLTDFGGQRFMEIYLKNTNMSLWQHWLFQKHFQLSLKHFP
jgi:serine/threonine protein kinase